MFKWIDLFDDLCRYGGLTDDRLATPTQPVDCGWLLVCAEVSTETDHLHARELALDKVNGLLHSLWYSIWMNVVCIVKGNVKQ